MDSVFFSDLEEFNFGLGVLDESFKIAGVTISRPDFIDLPPGAVPTADFFRSGIDSIRAEGVLAVASGVIPVVAKAAAAAAMIDPVAGAVVAVGASVASLFGSLFSGGYEPPPKPSIGGTALNDFTRNPIGTANRGAIAGKILAGGLGDIAGGTIEGIRRSAKVTFQHALRKLRDGASPDEVHKSLRKLSSPSSWRAVAYFASYAGYDTIFDEQFSGSAELREQIGKLLGWAVHRVKLREIFLNWWAYRIALAADAASAGNPNESIRKVALRKSGSQFGCTLWRGVTRPLPSGTVDFTPKWGSQCKDWPISRSLAQKEGGGSETRRSLIVDLVMPTPYKAGKLWVYHPIPKSIIESELENYYKGDVDVTDYIIGKELSKVKYPSSGEHLTEIPEKWADVVRYAYLLTAFYPSWKDNVRDALEDARKEITTGRRSIKAIGAAIKKMTERRKRQQAQIVKRVIKRSRRAKMAKTMKTTIAIGGAATVALLLRRLLLRA